MSNPDKPTAEDLAALDFSDISDDVEPHEPWNCQAMVLVSPTATRACARETTRAYTSELQPGLAIWYALCDEHASEHDGEELLSIDDVVRIMGEQS